MHIRFSHVSKYIFYSLACDIIHDYILAESQRSVQIEREITNLNLPTLLAVWLEHDWLLVVCCVVYNRVLKPYKEVPPSSHISLRQVRIEYS